MCLTVKILYNETRIKILSKTINDGYVYKKLKFEVIYILKIFLNSGT